MVFTATRSRGPGGQNVNKVNSAALLKWNFENSQLLSEEEKHLVRSKLGALINKAGLLYLRSDEFRDFEANKRRCIEKIHELLGKAFFKPKKRKKTKPTLASRKKRLESKKRRGVTKQTRQKVKC
ncbi:MAG: aminoacyl-tRNA hydrolase [Bdellovibrionales bacterium]|nr:aminoacyl-tRNA hydrolase [Bdellovibrionales bacterium]